MMPTLAFPALQAWDPSNHLKDCVVRKVLVMLVTRFNRVFNKFGLSQLNMDSIVGRLIIGGKIVYCNSWKGLPMIHREASL
jgi:hypothetical protein